MRMKVIEGDLMKRKNNSKRTMGGNFRAVDALASRRHQKQMQQKQTKKDKK